MQDFCDSCDEKAETVFDITRVPEFAEVVRVFNYRHVCQLCYDDLLEEIKKKEEHPEGSEQRIDSRHEFQMELQLEGINRSGEHFVERVITQDISQGGARIVINQDVEVGSILKVTVPESHFEGVAIVEIMWRHSMAHSVGLKVVEESDAWKALAQKQIENLTNL